MMFSAATLLAVFTLAVSARDSRTFAVNHFYGKGPLTEGRMDPILSPGTTSGHVHTVQGGNNFALAMSDTTLAGSTCTSSLVKNDKSDYWAPKIYFHDPNNGSFIDVPLYYMNVYYFFEATDDKITAFEPGHRMVIGNPTLRSPPATGGASITDAAQGTPQPVQFTCPRSNYNTPSYPSNSDGLHGCGIQDPNNQGAGVGFPDQNCDGTYSPLRADIHFPSCYNPAVGLDDYANNMAWPSSAGAGAGKQNCPEGWVHTPHIFYEMYWDTQPFADLWTPGQCNQPFVLACGDPTGYGLHADFISGWDVNTLQQIIDNCDAGDSGMDKCPGLIGGLNDPSTSCNIPDLIQESIYGVLEALPGNNPVTPFGSGSTNTTKPSTSSSASAPVSSSSSVASSSSGSASYPASSYTSGAAGYGSSSSSVPSLILGSSSSDGVGHVASSTATIVSTAASSSGKNSASVSSSVLAAPTGSSSPAVSTTPTSTGTPSSGGSDSLSGSAPASAQSSPCTSAAPTSNVTLPEGWKTLGCYSDNLDNRVLSGITFAYWGAANGISTSGCVAYCDQQGFSIAGTEYGSQCFCGTSLQGSNLQAASMCDMPCDGLESEICGGSLTLSVYQKSPSARAKRYLHHKHHHHAQSLRK